jgi:6-phosphogluconate dehydrogenase
MSQAQFGVVGLAVMGKNLALNIESRGYRVAVFNRSYEKTEENFGDGESGFWY